MRIVSFLSWTAIVVGALAIFAGNHFHIPKGIHLGVFLIGAGFALGGVESLFTRRMSFRSFSDAKEDYAGTPAVIWGLMALAIGTAIIAAAYVMRAGLWHATVSYVARHPGLAWVVVGLLLAGAGALVVLRPTRHSGFARRLFFRYPVTLVGLAIVLAGVSLAGIGLWEWYHPRGFDHAVRTTHDARVRTMHEAWKAFIHRL